MSLSSHTICVGENVVGEEEIASEFMMEYSHITRILAESQGFETSSTNNATQPSTADCGRPPRYDSCLGDKRNKAPTENCGPYNRQSPCQQTHTNCISFMFVIRDDPMAYYLDFTPFSLLNNVIALTIYFSPQQFLFVFDLSFGC